MQQAEIALTEAGGKTRTIRLERALSLGRSDANDLCYPEDTGLSRRHLIIEPMESGWQVRDLGSKNGTFVNGVRLTEARPLEPGDRVVASRVAAVFQPAAAPPKTVIFDNTALAGVAATASTTLGHVLSGTPGAAAPQPGPTQWASPITALLRAGRELAAQRPLSELFEVILDLAIEAVGAERGVLLTFEKGVLTAQASRGHDFHISTAVRDRVVEGKTSLLICDVGQDWELRDRHSIVGQRVRTLMAAPLQTDDRVIGLIYVDTSHLVRPFKKEDLDLLTVMANVAAIRIEHERLTEIEQAERLMARELQQAAEIQRRLLPAAPPVLPGLDLAGYNAPCHTVGGDYYDFLPQADGGVTVLIADVAGKGMPAALLMTNLQARVQALTESGAGPGALLMHLNRSMKSALPGNRFVTFFACRLSPDRQEIVYANAGHNPPLLMRASGERLRLVEGGPVLGILPELRFEESRDALSPGDVLVLYSDGVTEACNPGGEEFEEERLAQVVASHRGETAAQITEAVRNAVQEWTAGLPPSDDLTLVTIKRTV